jgi:hypothetical protein
MCPFPLFELCLHCEASFGALSVQSAGRARLHLMCACIQGGWGVGQLGMAHRSDVRASLLRTVVHMFGGGGGGVGQHGMAQRSDGPATSLRMFGHVHWAMCGGGCQFEVLEEHACT